MLTIRDAINDPKLFGRWHRARLSWEPYPPHRTSLAEEGALARVGAVGGSRYSNFGVPKTAGQTVSRYRPL